MSWFVEYERKRKNSAAEALKAVQSGMRVWVHANSGFPQVLADALTARAPELRDVEVAHLLGMGKARYAEPEYAASFRPNALFIGPSVRTAVNDGRADYTPIHLSEIEALFTSGAMPIDIALIHTSRPDEHGFVSLGTSIETTLSAARAAKYVIAQTNVQMPKTCGNTYLHVSEIDAFVEVDVPLAEMTIHEATAEHQEIAKHIAPLIEDGCTIQTGIGGIPDAILPHLMDRKNLGVHTETISEGAIPLIEAGVINGRMKTLNPNKVTLGFVLGTRRMYDYVRMNSIFDFRPNSYTNDPYVVARHDNMVAINSALEIDITGQVCSDSVGQKFYSGFGGQLDFIRGAGRSKNGKPVIALPATAKNGTISKIVPMLKPGAGVVTTRADVHFVATEFGIVNLHGKTVRERAELLISIAHPKFRKELLEHCEKMKWTRSGELVGAAAL
ncbi:acetyl-CoA hydrolase/transferase [Candidatus Koribacter versatilis Ellin345]|uniref:Acetyl-CoA hydrolase/transferase n=1 Tax=Koribacter versatilis (strain Ellin345) TaxID=204669 RepID=Q1IT47_KORVE|nr:acetyl-CoA hydrolase/transferase C-terminal domain-containing protein [Candidatus Koribacter versatilis]ABF39953.1 acetyl-CoA hydrolase/transferase [Candidatus Koribacter versatilis Ellin345]